MKAFIAVLSLVLAGGVASGQTPSPVEGLRCEYLVNPLGIDVEKPRLSWALVSGPREHGQSAYQILVASSPENLQRNEGDLWNSGKVGSSRTTFVVYDGRPLASGMRAWWKVRVWDRAGPRARGAARRTGPWACCARRIGKPVDRAGAARGRQRGHAAALPVAAQDVHAR